eukprot:31374-Chlamydomonas_euryale.AAC.1
MSRLRMLTSCPQARPGHASTPPPLVLLSGDQRLLTQAACQVLARCTVRTAGGGRGCPKRIHRRHRQQTDNGAHHPRGLCRRRQGADAFLHGQALAGGRGAGMVSFMFSMG